MPPHRPRRRPAATADPVRPPVFSALLTPTGTILHADGANFLPRGERWEHRPLWDLSCWTRETVRTAVQAAAAGRRVCWTTGSRAGGGRSGRITLTLAPLRDDGGAIRFLLAVAERSKKAVAGRGVPGPVHEINNALGTLGHALLLLRTTLGTGHPGEAYLDVAERQVARITTALRRAPSNG